jgi:hypothetical protein
LQRLFSSFANGSPGTGLLILRLASATFLIHGSFVTLPAVTGYSEAVPPIVAVGAGVLSDLNQRS